LTDPGGVVILPGMMNHGRPDAVLFDLDGTLIGTKALYLEAYRRAVEPYVRKELTPDDILALRPTSEIAFVRAVVAESDFDACMEDFYRVYEELHPGMFEGIFPGVPELLDALREEAVPLGLVTGKSRRSWGVTSAIVSLGPFDVLVFDDDVRAPKPDPHGLTLALDLLGVAPGRALYVGDNLSDLHAARAAGLEGITVLWARAESERAALAEQARQDGALAVLEEPGELHELLGLGSGRT
jgi:pyrophosphatase PpaX